MSAHLAFERDNLGDPFEEPGVDLAAFVDLFDAQPQAHRLRHLEQAIGRRLADRGAQHVVVVAEAKPVDLDLVQPVEAGLERAQRLLQRFGNVRPIAIASPTDFIAVVSVGSAPGNFSNAKRGIFVTM